MVCEKGLPDEVRGTAVFILLFEIEHRYCDFFSIGEVNMKVLITGASGLVGRKLSALLIGEGYQVGKLTRKGVPDKNRIVWDPQKGGDETLLEGWDAVVHLAGESLSKGMWTEEKKRKILESRKVGTENLVRALDKLKHPPSIFVSASGVGYYGDSEGALTEESVQGTGFLSEVCEAWEKAANGWKNHTPRVVNARFGYILSSEGGMLKALRSLFLWGLGGVTGSGNQFMPWVSVDDVTFAIRKMLEDDSLRGPVNVVSPNPVTQREFAKLLARALHRPCFFKVPERLLLGEKAKSLILPSLEAYPVKLLRSKFVFKDDDLYTALLRLLR